MPVMNIYLNDDTYYKIKDEENKSRLINDLLTDFYIKKSVNINVKPTEEIVDQLLTEANNKKLEADNIIKTIEEKKKEDEEKKKKEDEEKILYEKERILIKALWDNYTDKQRSDYLLGKREGKWNNIFEYDKIICEDLIKMENNK